MIGLAERKNGTEIAIDIELNFFGRNDNKQAIVILRDITEKKKVEEELMLHSQMVKNMVEGVYIVGLNDVKIKYYSLILN